MLNSRLESTVSGYSSKDSSNMLLRISFIILLLHASSLVHAKRYVVSDDAFGSTSATPLSELSESEKSRLEERESSAVSEPDSPTESSARVSDSLAQDPISESEALSDDQSQQSVSQPSIIEPNSYSSDSSVPSNVPDANSVAEQEAENPFERELRLSQENETDEVIRRLRANEGRNAYDATKVNPAEFVDSEDLLQGNVDSDGDRPFFVTFDGTGESSVIFYSPQVIKEEIERRKTNESVSKATVHSVEDVNQSISLPDNADPNVARILSLGEADSYFERFNTRCCNKIPNVGVLQLRSDKSLHVPIGQDDFSYRFIDGDSRYRLVRVPNLKKDYLLTVKTFVKGYKQYGIKHGAFIPQIVMLDRDKNVTRVISDISATSHAETWSSYGYLKSVIEVKQTDVDAETMLLVYTRAKDLRTVSVVEDSSGSWEVKHMEIGSLELEIPLNQIYP